MVAKPVAFAVIAVTCLAAAVGGAYVASVREPRSPKPQVLGQTTESATPKPVVSEPKVPAPAEEGVDPRVPARAPATPSEPSRSATPDSRRFAVKSPQGESTRTATARKGDPSANPGGRGASEAGSPKAADSQGVGEHRAPAAADATVTAAETDPPPQKPWPGSPAAPPVAADGVAASGVEVPAVAVPPLAFPPRRQRTFDEIVVPAQSVLGLSLETPLSTEQSRVEDRVEARVTRDVIIEGKVAIPAGTRAIGSVTIVERGGKVKERARLAFRFHTLRLPDDTELGVSTEPIYREGESVGRKSTTRIGGAAGVGAVIGAILGGGKGAAIGGGLGAAGGAATVMAGDRQAVVLRAGMPLSVRTEAAFTVTVER